MVDPQLAAPAFDPVESLEAFAHIGYGGTPPGMITSNWSSTATGQIGGGEVTEDSPPPATDRGVARRRLGVAAALLSVAVLGFVLYTLRVSADAPADAGPPEPVQVIVAPPPTAELEQVPSVRSAAREADNDKRGRRAAARKREHKSGSERSRKPSEPQPQCGVTVTEAERAGRRGRWDDVERLTRESQCWKSAQARKQLRMRALFELDRFEECLELGRGSSNAAIERLAEGCHKASRK